jgi:hypothetical protein
MPATSPIDREVIHKHTSVARPPSATVNPGVKVPTRAERVVMKCLAKNPDNRPQSPRELHEAFQESLAR